MDYRAAYIDTDGRTSIVIPAPKSRLPGESELDHIMRVAEKAAPLGVTLSIITTADLPAKRHFRNAWSIDHGTRKIGVAMTKARDIHRDNIRRARALKLEALDFEYLLADEQGNMLRKAAITAQKQSLRDLPADPAIENALTPDALMAVWPTSLLGTTPYT